MEILNGQFASYEAESAVRNEMIMEATGESGLNSSELIVLNTGALRNLKLEK